MKSTNIDDYLACDASNEFRNCNREYTCCCPSLKAQGVCPYMLGITTTEDTQEN